MLPVDTEQEKRNQYTHVYERSSGRQGGRQEVAEPRSRESHTGSFCGCGEAGFAI